MVKKLESIKVKAANGNGEVLVYDGDVDYQVAHSRNPSYYYDDDGVRRKTRPRVQHDGLLQRTKAVKGAYVGSTVSEGFKNFDRWVSWAQSQLGFMCEDNDGILFHLDKDLLGNGDKHYSEDTCCFIPNVVNGLVKVLNNPHIENVYCINTVTKTYMVSVNGKDFTFNSLDEAVEHSKRSFLNRCEEVLKVYGNSMSCKALRVFKEKMVTHLSKTYCEDFDKARAEYDSARVKNVRNKLVNFVADGKTKGLPRGIARSGSKYRIQILFEGKRVAARTGSFDKLKDAEIEANSIYLNICNRLIDSYEKDTRVSETVEFKKLIKMQDNLKKNRELLMSMYF